MQVQYILEQYKKQKDAVQKVREGCSYNEVARIYNVSGSTVARWCKLEGVHSCKEYVPLDARVERDIIDLVKYGANYEDVAREHLMNAKTIAKICKKHNIYSHGSLLKKKVKKNK